MHIHRTCPKGEKTTGLGDISLCLTQKSWTMLSSIFYYCTQVCACCMLSCFRCVWLFATPWMIAHWAPLSMEFSRQEYRSGLPCPPAEYLPHPGIEPESPVSPALAGGFFTTSTTWGAPPQLHHRRQEIHVILSICKKGERYKKTFFGSLQGKEMYGSL